MEFGGEELRIWSCWVWGLGLRGSGCKVLGSEAQGCRDLGLLTFPKGPWAPK